jgi:hypothetical protein
MDVYPFFNVWHMSTYVMLSVYLDFEELGCSVFNLESLYTFTPVLLYSLEWCEVTFSYCSALQGKSNVRNTLSRMIAQTSLACYLCM